MYSSSYRSVYSSSSVFFLFALGLVNQKKCLSDDIGDGNEGDYDYANDVIKGVKMRRMMMQMMKITIMTTVILKVTVSIIMTMMQEKERENTVGGGALPV